MPTITGKSQVANINDFYDRDLLDRALPLFTYAKFAQVRDIPRNNSDVIKFRKYARLSAATTALTEGTTPNGSALSVTDSSATVQQYGDYVTLTDKLQMETEDPIVMETNELLGEQVADTIDQLTRDVLVAGTSVQYASTAAARTDITAAMKITDAELREAVRTLKNNNARPVTQMVMADDAYDTSALRPSFISIIHPNTYYDLEQLTYFTPVEKYARYDDIMPGEVGSWAGQIRFIETTNAKVFTGGGSGGADVYATLIFGRDAYGVTRISTEALKKIIKPLGSAGTSDPLDQRSTIGWKITFVAVRLQEEWMLRLEHGVTA